MPRSFLVSALGLLALLFLLPVACDNHPSLPEQSSPYLATTSPANVLANLVQAYTRGDIEEYGELLAPDYLFAAAESAGLSFRYLSRGEDVASTAAMFARASTVALSLPHDDAMPSTVPGFPAELGYLMIEVPQADLVVSSPGLSGPFVIEVVDRPVRFVFDRVSSTSRWRIVYEEDLAELPPGDPAESWGDVKAFFLPDVPSFVPPTTPENALQNLVAAYAHREILDYRAVLAPDFEFIPVAWQAVGFSALDRADDIRSTEQMFARADRVWLGLDHDGWMWSDDPTFPSEEGYGIVDATCELSVYEGETSYVFHVDRDPLRFILRRSGDPALWQIVRVIDQHRASRGPARVASLSEVKAVYLHSEPTDYLPPTSPENVLWNLLLAHRLRDIEAYDAAIGDEYRFVPAPEDEVSWDELDRDTDHAATARMFGTADEISVWPSFGPATASEYLEFPAGDGYRMVAVSSIRIRVNTGEGPVGDPWIYEVFDNPAIFVFRPVASPEPGSEPTWLIVYQEDPGGHGRESFEAGLDPQGDVPVNRWRWGTLKDHYTR